MEKEIEQKENWAKIYRYVISMYYLNIIYINISIFFYIYRYVRAIYYGYR